MTETEVLYTEVTYEVWREVDGKDPRRFERRLPKELAEERAEYLQRDIDSIAPPGLVEFYVVKATTTRERVA